MTAREIMTPDPRCVTRDVSIRQISGIMRDFDIGFVPVVDDHDSKRLAGVITDRDIAIRCIAEGYREQDTVGDFMTSGFVAHVAGDAGFADILRLMTERRIRRVPVTGEGERLIGVVGMADLVRRGADSREVAALLARICEPVSPAPRGGRGAGSAGRPTGELAASDATGFVDRDAGFR